MKLAGILVGARSLASGSSDGTVRSEANKTEATSGGRRTMSPRRMEFADQRGKELIFNVSNRSRDDKLIEFTEGLDRLHLLNKCAPS